MGKKTETRQNIGEKMLTEEQAKKIGIRACMDKLGYDFCIKHKDNAVSAYGRAEGDKMECFVGVSDEPYVEPETPCLTSYYRWPYAARCLVDLHTGEIEFIEFRQKYSIESELREALMKLSLGKLDANEAELLAGKFAPQFDMEKFPLLGHKGINWFAKELLKVKCRKKEKVPETGIIIPYINTKFCLTDEMLEFLKQYLLVYRDYPDDQIAKEFSEKFGILMESAIEIERDYVVFNRRRIYNRISQYEKMGKSQAEAAELISVDFGVDIDNAKKYVFRSYVDSIDAFGVFIGNPELVDAEIYEPHPPIGIDIRAYSRYIREHGLTSDEITPEIMEQFKTGKRESGETS